MDNYNSLYLQQLAPFLRVLLSERHHQLSSVLRQSLEQYDISHSRWDNCNIRNRFHTPKFMIDIQTVDEGDAIVIPREKPVVGQSEGSQDREQDLQSHSILSPLNAQSDLFPNGILSEKWLDKYVHRIPFGVVRVFSLPSDASSDPELAAAINESKNQCYASNVKFVAVIVAEAHSSPMDDEKRVSRLRQLTNLPRINGLLYLHNLDKNLQRDCDVLASSLLTNLRTQAADFYVHIQQRVKDRHRKYYAFPSLDDTDSKVPLTPKFLETRNLIKSALLEEFISPNDLDSSARMLETAYSSLVSLLKEEAPLLSKSPVPHDRRLYRQFRTLIDVLSFHIVRAYLSLEEPVLALKKHKAHVMNVLSVMEHHTLNNCFWIATQYQWLGQLLSLVPHEILDIKKSLSSGKLRTDHIQYFGGVYLDDGFSDNLVTNPGLVFLQGVKYIDRAKESSTFMDLSASDAEMSKRKLELLDSASGYFDSTSSSTSSGIHGYIHWQLAEEYSRLDDAESTASAIRLYEKCLEVSSGFVYGAVVSRLVACYGKIASSDKVSESIVNVALRCRDVSRLSLVELHPNDLKSVVFDNSSNFFSVRTLLVTDTLASEAHVNDSCVTQISLESNVDLKTIKSFMVPGCSVSLSIDRIEIAYLTVDSRSSGASENGLEDVLIVHDDEVAPAQLQDITLEPSGSGRANLSMSETKILQFSQRAKRSGEVAIDSVRIFARIVISGEGHEVQIERNESLAPSDKRRHTQFYYQTGHGLSSQSVRLAGVSAHAIKISPTKPDIKIATGDVSRIVLGEHAVIPMEISFDADAVRALHYKRITLAPKVSISAAELETRINWDGLKDDEPLELESEGSHTMNVTVLAPPNMNEDLSRNLEATVELSLLIYDAHDDDSIAGVFSAHRFSLAVITHPFDWQLSIAPEYFTGEDDMPSPFLATDESNSMPIAKRRWKAMLVVTDHVDGPGDATKPLDAELELRTADMGILIDSGESVANGGTLSQHFTTRGKNDISQRNVTVVASARVRKQAKVYQSPEWNVVLPLADPRVLLSPQIGTDLELKYVIENPTPRIFTFSAGLKVEEGELEFKPDKNKLPFVLNTFPVLPFNRHVITYTAEVPTQAVKLPEFRVYDVNYMVNLPTLPTADSIYTQDEQLYISSTI